jgi:hypothetical protein
MNVLFLAMAINAACQADDFCRVAQRVGVEHGIVVYVSPLVGDLLGTTISKQVIVTSQRAVTINGTRRMIDRAAQVDVLCHEIGHALQPDVLRNSRRGELFAELVSERVHRRLGMRKSLNLRDLKASTAKAWREVEQEYDADIERVTRFLVAALEAK